MAKKVLLLLLLPASLETMQNSVAQKKSLLDRFMLLFCCSAEPPRVIPTRNVSFSQIAREKLEPNPAVTSSSTNTDRAQVSSSNSSNITHNSQDFLGSMNAPASLAYSSPSPLSTAREDSTFEEVTLN